MKSINRITKRLTVCVLGLGLALSSQGQNLDTTSDPIERELLLEVILLKLQSGMRDSADASLLSLDELTPMKPAEVPFYGTFWSRQLCRAPLPFNPFLQNDSDIYVDVYELPNGSFLLDDMHVDYDALHKQARAKFGSSLENQESMLRTFEQFASQVFSVIDTNAVSITDSNLYNACLDFPPDTNTVANLQIAMYGANAVIIKANHFDYSAETERDVALLVSSSVELPLWKAIDFSGDSYNQDGWLVQGTVPRHHVTDPMFLMVSNITQIERAFFHAVPYGGPQVQLTAPQSYETVSNVTTLHALVTDLSGVTNVQFSVDVDGLPARYVLGTNSTILLDTKYFANGLVNVNLNAFSQPRVYEPASLPDNAKLFFSGIGALPLNFSNPTCLAFSSDYASPDIGTNTIIFSIDQARDVSAKILNPANGGILASFSGYVPAAANVGIQWNFTQADGVTPYTNDNYAVEIVVSNSTTLTITNKIDRMGVRPAAGCFLSYQEENPMDLGYGPGNAYLNDQARMWIGETLKTLYEDLYKPLSITQYSPGQIGANRNHAGCVAQDPSNVEWALFLQPAMTNSYYSDLTIAQAHGNGFEIGGGPYLPNKFTSYDLSNWVLAYQPPNRARLRKAAIWTCYSGSVPEETGTRSFAQACGIRDAALQMNSYMRKNCGLFFGGLIDQGWVQGGETVTTARAAAFLDQIWICGNFPVPGSCDPTYSFRWAALRMLSEYDQVKYGDPRLFGCPKLIYSSVFEDELLMLDWTHVKEN